MGKWKGGKTTEILSVHFDCEVKSQAIGCITGMLNSLEHNER